MPEPIFVLFYNPRIARLSNLLFAGALYGNTTYHPSRLVNKCIPASIDRVTRIQSGKH
jgi:hypothetical protein